ncbi:hypothetical protein V1527DRAFT_484857 [Lipomyces starkeyi]
MQLLTTTYFSYRLTTRLRDNLCDVHQNIEMARNPRRLIQEERKGRKLSEEERRLVDDFRLSERKRLSDYRARKRSRSATPALPAPQQIVRSLSPDDVPACTHSLTMSASTTELYAGISSGNYDFGSLLDVNFDVSYSLKDYDGLDIFDPFAELVDDVRLDFSSFLNNELYCR